MLFLPVTEGDNRGNPTAAQLASEALGIGRVIAKINDPVRPGVFRARDRDPVPDPADDGRHR